MIFPYLGILGAASGVLAMTPQGFSPGVSAPLFLVYSNSIAALNGASMSRIVTAKEPLLATDKKMTGKSYAVMMVDIDIPTAQPPKTNSLLHWMQTDLVPGQNPVTVNTSSGTMSIFPIQNLKRVVAAAPYIGPDPPARVPLNHRYTQVLVDTSNVGQDQISLLSKAATNRDNFNVAEVLTAANIPLDRIVAGNFFQVTNPGPAMTGPLPPTSPSNPKPVSSPSPGGNNPGIPRPNTNVTGPATPKAGGGNGTGTAMPKPINGGNSSTPKPGGTSGTGPMPMPMPVPGAGSNSTMPKPGTSAPPTAPPVSGKASSLGVACSAVLASVAFGLFFL